jgi:hypothetical protein
VSFNRTNLRSEHGSERGARFRELNQRGVRSAPTREEVATVFNDLVSRYRAPGSRRERTR